MLATRLHHRGGRRGFTLTELAIVIGIIGIVMSAIWIAAVQVSNANKVQKATAEVMQIVNGYRSLYARSGIDVAIVNGWGSFNDVTCMGINAGYFPAEMNPVCITVGATTTYSVNSPWATTSVFVATQKTYNTILISFGSLSQAACVQFSSSVFNSPDVTYQAIYGGPGGNQFLPPYGANTSYTQSQIQDLCSGGAGANPYDVQVGFTAH